MASIRSFRPEMSKSVSALWFWASDASWASFSWKLELVSFSLSWMVIPTLSSTWGGM